MAQLTMNFDRRYALCILKLYHRPHFTVGGCWNKSLHLKPLQRCYCENSGSTTSACIMRRHYSITYMQSLHSINGLLAVGRVGNLLCGRPSYLQAIYVSLLKTDVILILLIHVINQSINLSVLPKGRSFTANSAVSTLPSSKPSFSYLHTVHLS